MRNGKSRGKTFLAVGAAAAAAALVCLVFALPFPEGTESRYVLTETYDGMESVNAAPEDHGSDHTGWTDLNYLVGTATAYAINDSGKYYLSDDLDAHLSVGPTENGEDNKIVVDLCLNGHVLGGTGNNATVTVGDLDNRASDNRHCVMNLYDCGGEMEKHYYKLRDDGVSYTFYELESGGILYATDDDGNRIPFSEGNSDGYVRGGLITGGNGNSDAGYGGGITIKENSQKGGETTLNVYGGTIAGNVSSNGGGGISVESGKLNMYGGSVEGNQSSGGVPTALQNQYGGAGVGVYAVTATADTGSSYFCMYGGTIRNNFCGGWGGGVEVNGASTSYGAEFTMYGGTIEGNRAQYGGGVGMYDYYNNTTQNHAVDVFRMYGGTIRDNTSVYGGGGIYVYSSGSEIEINGGTITGNVQEEIESGASNYGGGIDFFNEDTVTVGGAAYVYGNHCAGKTCNVGIAAGHYITLGELTEGAMIGVTLQSPSDGAEITVNYVSGAEAYFSSDDRSYKVAASGGSYLALKTR